MNEYGILCLIQQGRFQFAINTRPPEASDGGTSYVKLFLDGLCIAVNKGNSISNISKGTNISESALFLHLRREFNLGHLPLDLQQLYRLRHS